MKLTTFRQPTASTLAKSPLRSCWMVRLERERESRGRFIVVFIVVFAMALFQNEEFERMWSCLAQTETLSDQEKDLFDVQPPPPPGLFDDNPMFSAAPFLEDDDMFGFDGGDDGEPSRRPDVIYYSDSDAAEGKAKEDDDDGQTRQEEEEKEAEREAPVAETRRPVRQRRRQKRGRRRPRPAARRPEPGTSDDDDDKEGIFSNGKPKLYAERPFKNPQLERARLNAINAKKNRDRKKQESARMEGEMRALREQNARMQRSLRRFEVRAEQAERELEAIKTLLRSANLGDLLKLVSGN